MDGIGGSQRRESLCRSSSRSHGRIVEFVQGGGSEMSAQAAKSEIEIRSCATLAEYEECVRIEHLIWGEDMALPSPIFVVAHHTGGQVLGAFDGPNMIGFTLG